jgi:hypothetical protein
MCSRNAVREAGVSGAANSVIAVNSSSRKLTGGGIVKYPLD